MDNLYVKKEEYSTTDVAVVILPFPAHGHMAPLLYFASRLVSAATISLYFAGSSREIRRAKDRAQGWDPSSSANIRDGCTRLGPVVGDFRPFCNWWILKPLRLECMHGEYKPWIGYVIRMGRWILAEILEVDPMQIGPREILNHQLG